MDVVRQRRRRLGTRVAPDVSLPVARWATMVHTFVLPHSHLGSGRRLVALAFVASIVACGGHPTRLGSYFRTVAPQRQPAKAMVAVAPTSRRRRRAGTRRVRHLTKRRTAIDTAHGRLDGTLIQVVPVGDHARATATTATSTCRSKWQVSSMMSPSTSAAPLRRRWLHESTLQMPGGPWSQGCTAATASPIRHSDCTPPTLRRWIHQTWPTRSSLASNVTQVSVFCTGYSQEDGCHDVHYKDGAGDDGAIVLNPTAASSSTIFLRFTTRRSEPAWPGGTLCLRIRDLRAARA